MNTEELKKSMDAGKTIVGAVLFLAEVASGLSASPSTKLKEVTSIEPAHRQSIPQILAGPSTRAGTSTTLTNVTIAPVQRHQEL